MTKAQAMYELMELAGTLIHKSVGGEHPPELFTWCRTFQDESLDLEPTISGSKWSDEFTKVDQWLKSK